MTALSDNRDTPEILSSLNEQLVGVLTVYAAEILYAGGMGAVDYTSEIQMASDSEGLRVVGRVPKKVDNTDDGESSNPVDVGIFRYANSATYALTRRNIGQVCYVEDDNIVAGSSTYLIAAGIVHDVDSSGVWVDQRPQSLALARRMARAYVVTTAAAATATAAQCFQENCLFAVAGTASVTLTLPTAIAGYRVGVQRTSATATHDVVVQAPTGDTIRGSAAAGAITNSTDLVSDVLWLLAISAVAWVDDNPVALDRAAWAAST